MKRKTKNEYFYFKTKFILKALGLILAACVATCLIYNYLWHRRGGDWLVGIFHDVFMLDIRTSRNIYHQLFVNNERFIWVICTTVIFTAMSVVLLNSLIKYFRQIDRGIDALLSENPQDITLSPELSALEGKLNTVRQTLDRRTAEAKLAEQRKNDLVMYLAHDIRTPLTSVIGYLNLLDEAPEMPMELRAKYTHITLDKANRLEALVNEFFEITRYNLQQIPLQKEEVDLSYLLLQMTEEFYPILSQKNVTLELNAPEELRIWADPVKLARVVSNILRNAAAYSDPGSQINVQAEKSGKDLKISVQNQGPTIPAEKLTAIFDRFYRLDDARGTATGGAGLGLAIAKEIVTAHGGTIAAESENGRTTFTVTLPAEEGTSL